MKELLEVTLPAEENERIAQAISSISQVKAYHHLRTRHNGNAHVIDVHIKVDPSLTVTEAHEIASMVEQRLEQRIGNVITSIHIEPYKGELTDANHMCSD